ncbi:enoyl-CoA hydratase/isomerase family protein [Alkalihalobacterium alkalinitrilicum]|uniref:enoyl-CoA hydratase/isomerase family protein n=1 Tax=Alkalihalobacterium alkalinitrilicum TaxID=427920 RepID=UPI000995274C|nr:enoyl-CoA hydratase/isomerase family protein [Alkalihalobacterium alkalinitrilicum]
MESIMYEEEGSFGIIRLNRPEVLNALNYTIITELIELLDQLEENPEPRVLIITGTERSFSAGADLKSIYEMQQAGKSDATGVLLDQVATLFNKIETYTKPVIAAIDGIAYGGGCELALACDIRIATHNARIGLSEVKLGVLPAGGGTQRLPRLIGLSRAKYMLLCGEPLDNKVLQDWGLIYDVVSSNELIQKAKEISEPFLNGAPLSQKAIKNAALASTNTDITTGIEIERHWSSFLHQTADAKEGIAAFNQKRKPVYKGQ